MPKVKVFYVEDEPFLAQIVQESLESRGYIVHLVDDGNTALSAFQAFQPDICVLDIMLPHKDGYAIAREIKTISPVMPVIFLTAKNQTQDVLQGFEAGGNDYLRKPFSMEELIARIDNLIQLSKGGANQVRPKTDELNLGRYVFSPRRYELRMGEQIRQLSHRETLLLQILTEDTSQPVLRKDILMHIWGDDSFFNSRNLDVYITKLREYLRDDPDIQILTIKGVGYHFLVK
jgi:DNA-binding response OmpR family regulator